MKRGYIKLWRKALDTGMLGDHKLWAFWCYCLLRANYEPVVASAGLQQINLEPGQFIFGRAQAAKDLNLSEWQVRRCLAFLVAHQQITIKTTNKFSIVTIINWPTYQADNLQNRQQTTTEKNIKNIYGGKFLSVDESLHTRFLEAYPSIDLIAEYRKMDAWLAANPNKRKTPRGYPRFINNWLSKGADTGKETRAAWWDKLPQL